MQRVNVHNVACESDPAAPEGYDCGAANVGRMAGGEALVVKVYELAGGNSVCPYHYEYEEEWLLVLSGAVTLRTPEGESELGAGELVCFAPGPVGAHKVTNNGSEVARIAMFSRDARPAVAVYPDSDKIGVWPGNREDNALLHRRDGRLDYWEGER